MATADPETGHGKERRGGIGGAGEQQTPLNTNCSYAKLCECKGPMIAYVGW